MSGARRFLLEEREIDTAVLAVLHKTMVAAEVVVLAMFKHEKTAIAQEIALKNKVGEVRYLFEDIWRIGKDEIESLTTLAQVLEHVSLDRNGRRVLQLVQKALDETVVHRIIFYAYDTGTTARQQLQGDAASTGKEIQGNRFLVPVHIGIQDVEEVFLGKIRCRTSLESTRNIEMTTFILSCYNTHGQNSY